MAISTGTQTPTDRSSASVGMSEVGRRSQLLSSNVQYVHTVHSVHCPLSSTLLTQRTCTLSPSYGTVFIKKVFTNYEEIDRPRKSEIFVNLTFSILKN